MFQSKILKAAQWKITIANSCRASTLSSLPKLARDYVEEKAKICQPDKVVLCDGSESESLRMLQVLHKQGQAKPLSKYENCWLVQTDPADVARLESRTFMVTEHRSETLPATANGVECKLGNWKSPSDFEKDSADRFPGCMRGRTMYVLPFSMGPVGGPISKLGLQCTDSEYVVASMRIMTRMGKDAQNALFKLEREEDFVRCVHSVGRPLPLKANEPALIANWPCNPKQTIIAHVPERNEIASFGSGYGGNSLLGKKCFALRLGSILARREGWLAEHMLILGVTDPSGHKKYVAAAFPSACGKTNLAMMQPTLPGWKVECVGDDIAWMKFDSNGILRAINPEAGFFGVAPGTSMSTNPNAMRTIQRNTIFTNVAQTDDGGVFWEGLEHEVDLSRVKVTSWLGEKWTLGDKKPSSHPNSRFCTPASQCPVIDPAWESADGVPISAIIFGGRRPHGVPLVMEARNWRHGVYMGASMRSETTAAAEHTGKQVMNDPFAMRPFFGYNFGHYLDHWLQFENQPNLKLPKIFHVNWFRKDANGKFMWPGFGENSRVIDWICRRVDAGASDAHAQESAVGWLPVKGSLNLTGIKPPNMEELFHLPKDFWQREVMEMQHYFEEQVGADLPQAINIELAELHRRVNEM